MPVSPPSDPPEASCSSSARPVSPRSIRRAELVALLGSGLDPGEVHEAVTAAAEALGLTADPLDRQGTLAVLDHLGKKAGMIGLSARFAKTRLILRFAA